MRRSYSMKKDAIKWILSFMLIGLCMACLSACADQEEAEEEPAPPELALITDAAGVNDGSFYETTWKAMQAFAEENGMGCQDYNAGEGNEAAYLKAIGKARAEGAKLVVLPGSQFETVAYEAQKKYEDLYFVLLDGVPRDEAYHYKTAARTISVLFAEQEAGYLAGYAAVCEGYRQLGFMGGDDLPSVKRYGYGFIQGVSAAVREKQAGDVDLKYTYTGTFEASDQIRDEAAAWYEDGTEVIFACGGSLGESVMDAAEKQGGRVIGVDADQSGLSETVITSARKETGRAITDILKNYKHHNFGGGAILNYSAENKGIGLEMTNARMTVFDAETYKEIYRQIRKGDRQIQKDLDGKKLKSLADERVHVEKIKK